jgi:hypothetical protein
VHRKASSASALPPGIIAFARVNKEENQVCHASAVLPTGGWRAISRFLRSSTFKSEASGGRGAVSGNASASA